MSRRLVSLSIIVFALLLPTSAIAADDAPLTSDPGVHQVLTRAPSAVNLAFAWEINSEDARIYVLDKDDKNVSSSAPSVDTTNVTVQLDTGLDPGTYTVYYRVNGRTGGMIGGSYQFAIKTAHWTTLKKPVWSGSAHEPAMFKGDDPNQPASKDPTPSATVSPGLEIVTKDGKVIRPAPITRHKAKAASSSHTPWLIGGGAVVIVAALGTAFALKRRGSANAYVGKRVK